MDYIKTLELYRDRHWQMMLRVFHFDGNIKAAVRFKEMANIIDDCISFLRRSEIYPPEPDTGFDDDFSNYKYGEWIYTKEKQKGKETT